MKNALLIMMPPPDLWGVRDMAVFRNQSNSTSASAANNRNSMGTNWEQDVQPRDERIVEVI
jgi:hypothetical protein